MSKIKAVTIHAGHNPKGKIACGASDYIDESTEARIIVKKVKALLKKNITQELPIMVLEIVQLEVKIFIIHLVMIQSAMQHSITQQVAALQIQ